MTSPPHIIVKGAIVIVHTGEGWFELMGSDSFKRELMKLIDKHGGKLIPKNLKEIIKE
jgi:hypothetical protein